jgi:hypothetical protein
VYHPRIVEAKIDQALKLGRIPQPPTYHSRGEVDEMIARLESIVNRDEEGRFLGQLRPLDVEEIQWIRNERFLCRVDFRYWVSRYIWIKNEEDRIVRFIPWPSQDIYLDVLAENDLERIAIMLQVLKARQLGISRVNNLAGLHRVTFFKHINAVLASSTPDKTRKLAEMFLFPFDRLPWWMVPQISYIQDTDNLRVPAPLIDFVKKWGSGVDLQHGSQITGLARGTTPTVSCISELCEFADGGELIDASLLRSMHDSIQTFLVLESTALGQYNWWHKKWLSSKAGWPERRSRLRPVFLPWFVGGLYPKEVWLRARPVPTNYIPEPWVIEHAERARAYVQANTLLTKHLGSGWQMPTEQLWYYEVERGEAMREGRLSAFLQEMPASDDEAFQSTNISVFSTEVITLYRDLTGKRNPVGVYGLEGPSNLIHPRFTPHHTLFDVNRPPIHLKYTWGMGNPVPFTLRPLRWEGWPNDSGLDKIYIWEMPEDGEIYGWGYDTSDGIEKDRTTAECLRKGSPWRKAAQVAEFCSGKLNALDGLPFLMALGQLYSVRNTEGVLSQPRMAIECKGNGDQTQLKLQLLGWHNFHPWIKPDNRHIDRNKYHKIGVFTNTWFRAGMLEYLIKMLRDDEIEIWSPEFVKEMQGLEGDDFRQSLKAAHGGHDDRIMALGFVIISLYQYERNRDVAKVTGPRPAVRGQQRVYARWSPGAQEIDSYGLTQNQIQKLTDRVHTAGRILNR